MTRIIKNIKVYESNVNYHNGENIGPGFAVMIDKELTKSQVWQVADAIKYALEGLVLKED